MRLPFTSTPWTRRFATKPRPSVLWPVSVPSASTTTQLLAPMSSQAGLRRSRYFVTSVLQGMVTLKPPQPRSLRAATASPVFSSGTS